MQLLIATFMNQTPDVIDNWCTPTNHKLNVGMDKCLLSVIAYLETEVKSGDSAIYNSPVPSKDVSRPSPSISPTLSHQRRLSLRIGIWLAAGGEELDPRLDHETQNRAGNPKPHSTDVRGPFNTACSWRIRAVWSMFRLSPRMMCGPCAYAESA